MPRFSLVLILLLILCVPALAQTAAEMRKRALEFYQDGHYQQAQELAEQAYQQSLKTHGEVHEVTADCLHTQAEAVYSLGEYEASIALYRRVFEIRREVLGERAPLTALTLTDLGLPFKKLGRFQEAEKFYRQAYEILKEVEPEGRAMGRTLNNLATLYLELRRFAPASEMLAQAVELKRRSEPGSASLAVSLNGLGYLHFLQKNYQQAADFYAEALEIDLEKLGAEHPETIKVQSNLGVLLLESGELTRAATYLEQALASKRKVFGEQHPSTALAYANLADLNRERRLFEPAAEQYGRALAVQKVQPGSRHPDYALTLNNFGALELLRGRGEAAQQAYEQALEIMEQSYPAGHPRIVLVLKNLAYLYNSRGQDEQVASLVSRVAEAVAAYPGQLSAQLELADFYAGLGRYVDAAQALEKAWQTCRQARGPDDGQTLSVQLRLARLQVRLARWDTAEQSLRDLIGRTEEAGLKVMALAVLADLHRDLGDLEQAYPLLLQALEIGGSLAGSHPAVLEARRLMARVLLVSGRYEEAVAVIRAVLESEQKPEVPVQLEFVEELCFCLWSMGAPEKAEPFLQKCLLARRQYGSENSFESLRTRYLLAQLQGVLGKAKESESQMRSLMPEVQRMHGDSSMKVARIHDGLARALLAQGRLEEAQREARLAESLVHRNLKRVLSFTSEDERLRFRKRAWWVLSSLATVGEPQDLAALALAYKGVVLDSLAEDIRLAQASDDPRRRALVEQLRQASRRLGQLNFEDPQDRSVAGLEAREQKMLDLERRIAELEAELARGTRERRASLRVTPEQVQRALPPDTVLLEFLVYRKVLQSGGTKMWLGAVVLTREEVAWVPLMEEAEVEQLMRVYRRAMRGQGASTALLSRLYEKLWKPVDAHFPAGTKTVVISPDGPINFLSFATLLVGQNTFLSECYQLVYVASGRHLLLGQPARDQGQALLFGGVDFAGQLAPADGRAGPQQRALRGLEFPPLPGSKQECLALRDLLEQVQMPVTLLSGEAAREGRLKNLSEAPHILHLATHGFMVPSEDSDHAPLQLFEEAVLQSPMLRCGLALSGAGATVEAWRSGRAPAHGEDGILNGQEISTLELGDTQLVVLSACDTGLGKVADGEGVLGLRLGFKEAGARNLLMSLWPVADFETVELMRSFYRRWLDGVPAPLALAAAQKEQLLALKRIHGVSGAARLAGPFVLTFQGPLH